MNCTCHIEEIEGTRCLVVSPVCEIHAPQQPYISRVGIALKEPTRDSKRHTSHAPKESSE